MAEQFYVSKDGHTSLGPYSSSQIKLMARSGELLPDHTLWREGAAQRVYARQVKGLFDGTNRAASSSSAQEDVDVPADELYEVVDGDGAYSVGSFSQGKGSSSSSSSSSSDSSWQAAGSKASGTPASFPRIVVPGGMVDPRALIEPGTGMALTGAWILGAILFLLLCLITYGVFLIFALISPLITHFTRKRALALLEGSGIRIGPDQLPQIDECVKVFAQRLGMTEMPICYIVEDSVMNASVFQLSGRDRILLLTDDLVHGCLQTGNSKALAFVIGHELGHIALGHTKMVRGYFRRILKKLSRLDEFTVDRVGSRLVNDPEASFEGLLVLTTGPHLLPYIRRDSIKRQALGVRQNKYTKKAERTQTHPLLLNRISRILGQG